MAAFIVHAVQQQLRRGRFQAVKRQGPVKYRFYLFFPDARVTGLILSRQCWGNTLTYWVTDHFYDLCNILRLLLVLCGVKRLVCSLLSNFFLFQQKVKTHAFRGVKRESGPAIFFLWGCLFVPEGRDVRQVSNS